MHIKDIDLNLLRVFDAIYCARSVSRAAQRLGITQPAASQALARLRLLLGDALFVRTLGGVVPTPRSERLAATVQPTLVILEQALGEASHFDPAQAQKTFRLHLSDIGEARFLPAIMATLHQQAPGVRIESSPLPHSDITGALDNGSIDFALGYLPSLRDTQHAYVLRDHYIILLRAGHPFLHRLSPTHPVPSAEELRQLEFVAVRSHAQTLHILQRLQLENRLRLTTAHFLTVPAIVRESNLGVVMPCNTARDFLDTQNHYAIIELPLPSDDFTVALHWSRRFETDPSNRWMRQTILGLFEQPQPSPE